MNIRRYLGGIGFGVYGEIRQSLLDYVRQLEGTDKQIRKQTILRIIKSLGYNIYRSWISNRHGKLRSFWRCPFDLGWPHQR